MAASSDASDDVFSQINVTPLVDVMLVLLVVMMVTASTVVAQSLDVKLPDGATGRSQSPPLIFVVHADGEVRRDGAVVDDQQLRQLARQRVASGGAASALIAADGDVAHRHVVHVMDVLRSEQLTQLAIGVQAPQGTR